MRTRRDGEQPRAQFRDSWDAPAGMGANSILPTTFDLEGSSIAAIQAGQLMFIAAVPCRSCAETSSALKPAYPGGEYLPSSTMKRSASIAAG